jgi:nucleotide-binding universal stress UspA family protein
MKNTVLVQMADTKWTTAAVQAAVDVAREQQADITLVKMLPASYLNWQGMDARDYRFTDADCEDLYAYEAIARSANVNVQTAVYKYDDLGDGLNQAADELGAETVIATTPHHRDLAQLDHSLEAHHHHLYTVEQPAACCSNWQPKATAVHHN